MLTIRVKRLHKAAIMPSYAHPGEDAGFDLFLIRPLKLKAGWLSKEPLGIAIQLPIGYYAQILGRSSLASNGISILGGVIDSGYRGEWHALLHNGGQFEMQWEAGQKIAQAVLLPVPMCEITEVEELSTSSRGSCGWGSTDAKWCKICNQPLATCPHLDES